MTGSRYLLSGQRMPHLIPFVEQMLGTRSIQAHASPKRRPTSRRRA